MPFVPDSTPASTGRFVPDTPAGQDPAFTAAHASNLKGTKPADSGDSAAGFVGGNLNLGMGDIAGFPVDFARHLVNLGVAAYGTAKGAAGGTPPDLVPTSSPGGSEWMGSKIKKAGLVPDSATPQSPLGEYAARALRMAPSALIPMGGGRAAPALAEGAMPQLKQAASALAPHAKAMVPAALSGVGAQAGTDIGGPEWAGVGAMAPGARGIMKPPTAGEAATAGRKNETFQTSKGLGIPVPPRNMKADSRLQSQEDALNQELRQPPGTEVSPKTLQQYRAAHADNYAAVIKSPELAQGVMPNSKFQQEIQRIGDEVSKPGAALPETFKGMRGVVKLLKEYGYGAAPAPQYSQAVLERNPQLAQAGAGTGKPIPPDVAMRAITKLRSDASSNYRSDQPEAVQLAGVQRRIATSLEDLIEANLKTPETIAKFRESRTAMAKSHAIEDSLDPKTRKFDAGRLSKLYTEGSPLTGNLKKLAEVGGEFPAAMSTPQDTGMFSKRMSPFGVTHPGAIAAHGMAKYLDPIKLSKPYQEAFVNPENKATPEQLRMLRYFLGAQGANQIPAPPEARADGGPVNAGQPYMVGERGPEIVVPRRSGNVIPTPPPLDSFADMRKVGERLLNSELQRDLSRQARQYQQFGR